MCIILCTQFLRGIGATRLIKQVKRNGHTRGTRSRHRAIMSSTRTRAITLSLFQVGVLDRSVYLSLALSLSLSLPLSLALSPSSTCFPLFTLLFYLSWFDIISFLLLFIIPIINFPSSQPSSFASASLVSSSSSPSLSLSL